MSGLNYYELLGVNATATDGEIRRAYLKLAVQWHPDKRRGGSSGTDVFHFIQEAYETLSCPEKRCLYDFVGCMAMFADVVTSPSCPFQMSSDVAAAQQRLPKVPSPPSVWSSGSSGDTTHPWGPTSSSSGAQSSPCPSSDTCISYSSCGITGGAFARHASSLMKPGVVGDMQWSSFSSTSNSLQNPSLDPGLPPPAVTSAAPHGPCTQPMQPHTQPWSDPSVPVLPPSPNQLTAGPSSPSSAASILGKRLRTPFATDPGTSAPAAALTAAPPAFPQGATSGPSGLDSAASHSAPPAQPPPLPMQPAAGANVQHQLVLTLEEMYCGCVKQLRLQRRVYRHGPQPAGIGLGMGLAGAGGGAPVGAPHAAAASAGLGAGLVGGCSVMVESVDELFRVEVQPGWREGTKVTFPGKGNVLPGGSAGDMVLVVSQAAHGRYERRGHDLHTVVEVPLVDALTGGHTAVTTLDGRQLVLALGPACLQPFTERVLKGEGMPIPPRKAARGRAAAASVDARAAAEIATAGGNGAVGGVGVAAAAAEALSAGWGRGDLHVRFRVAFPTELTSAQKEELRRTLLEQGGVPAGSAS